MDRDGYRIYIFDYEVFAYDFILVAKPVGGIDYTVIHNDNDAVREFFDEDNLIVAGFNNKRYDNFITKAIFNNADNQELKLLNDYIISGGNAWEHPLAKSSISFNSLDLMDDCQTGLSLKAIEAHLGMDIRETTVPFDIDRPLTDKELDEVIFYCKHDVDATERLYKLRKNYLNTKLYLGREKGIEDAKALYMTNAKLTAEYLGAVPHEWNDERQYKYPDNLLIEYIPDEVFAFFDKLYDTNISDGEVFSNKLDFMIGECQCTLGFGGIHGAIPTYREKSTDKRTIRNRDVGSYYPHLLTIDGYISRNILEPGIYSDMLEERMTAKKSGDKDKANALKLVANTTYGGMLNPYNALYDPLNARSVCITGQLRLIELACHLNKRCKSLIIIQLNTDGIMVSLDNEDIETYNEICDEWQKRTGFELEEDEIGEIIQKDVNGYIEIKTSGEYKVKGGYLVRGIAPAGAFNINNNATIVSEAVIQYFVKGTPVEETINNCNDIFAFQLIAKASSKYSAVYHVFQDEMISVQKCNRVYATSDMRYGNLIKIHKETGTQTKIANLPRHCIIDNNNILTILDVDKQWYIQLAKRYINDFLGVEPPKKNTRKINSLMKEALKLFEKE